MNKDRHIESGLFSNQLKDPDAMVDVVSLVRESEKVTSWSDMTANDWKSV